jgi:hypothetical protein
MCTNVNRYLLLLASCFLILNFHFLIFIPSAKAQDLLIRRSNDTGNWIGYLNNNGSMFNQTDSLHEVPLGAGGIWTGLGRFDTVVFGAGLWFGGLRHRNDSLLPHVEFSYNPNSARSEFAPGSILYDGAATDTTQPARDKYRVYRSDDIVPPSWPLRTVNGESAYIDSVSLRASAGPMNVLGDEDLFLIYKDSDSDSISDPFEMEVRTRASFWSKGLMKNVVTVENQIVYAGIDTIFDPVIALVVDGDINNPFDDRTKGVQSEGVSATVFFTDTSTTDPLLGVTVLDGLNGPDRFDVGVTSLRYWDATEDPITDSDRYAFLTEPRHDTALSVVGDARILMASLSQTPIVPGDTFYFEYALYVQPATGPALTSIDSASMLRVAQTILDHYRNGTLDQLQVNEQTTDPIAISAFPNPASDMLYLMNGSKDAILYDELGRMAAKAQSEYGYWSFDVRSLPDGIYFVRSPEGSLKVEISH